MIQIVPDARLPFDLRIVRNGVILLKVYGVNAQPNTQLAEQIVAALEGQAGQSDEAYCIGCGTYPKGPYTCATCSAADDYEGPKRHVSDWPANCRH